MRYSFESGPARVLSTLAFAALATLSVSACTLDGTGPRIEAVVASDENDGIIVKRFSSGQMLLLMNGTVLEVQCINAEPSMLAAEITSGSYAGQLVLDVDRSEVEATADPDDSASPGLDPFEDLDDCSS